MSIHYSIWLIPPISGLIGWITNYIAVRMIFRPRKPISFFGIKFWGLIPKRKSDLARKIGETIEKELISHEDIHAVVNTASFHDEILDSVMAAIEKFISQKLAANPLIAMFVSSNMLEQLKEMVRTEIRTMLPIFLESMFEKMEQKMDFKEIIRKKIEAFDLGRFETIIYSIASKELRSIEILGGILGFIIGMIQLTLIALSHRPSF